MERCWGQGGVREGGQARSPCPDLCTLSGLEVLLLCLGHECWRTRPQGVPDCCHLLLCANAEGAATRGLCSSGTVPACSEAMAG